MNGIIFNIQRFSVNDGPGIRTTVFLKGCPLRCRWCHNPESIAPNPQLLYREDRCIGCGDCVKACKQRAVSLLDNRSVTSAELCRSGGDCASTCYAEARELVGKELSVAEVMHEVEKDVVFFDESNGGVTFSGGEPLLQHEFLLALLQASKETSLHTVVDTTGYTSPKILERVMPFVDLFLYDLKTVDEAKHKQYTGVSNRLILDNLHMLVSQAVEVIVRVPVIPGINDSPRDIEQIGDFVARIGGIRELQLLPYHQTGLEKYRRLGMEYSMPQAIPPTPERMNEIASELADKIELVSVGG
jgi:pyruvate formate lyase activating enzyme